MLGKNEGITEKQSGIAGPMANPAGESRSSTWPELLSLALILTFAFSSLPAWWLSATVPREALAWLYRHHAAGWAFDGMSLLFGLLLALPRPLRSGIRIGRIEEHWWKVLLITLVPIALTAIVYPRLPVHPFKGASASMWFISPLAQDLVFMGYLYGRFEELAPRRLHPHVPINGALLLASLFFALWHAGNFLSMTAGYVLFQMAYVFIGALWVGTTRVWTGSLLYGTIVHMAANAIAWATS